MSSQRSDRIHRRQESMPHEDENWTGHVVPEKRKRTKYVARACIECKRRKTKCSGEQPCGRCLRQRMDCTYQSESPMRTGEVNMEQLLHQIQSLQAQIGNLTSGGTPKLHSRPSQAHMNDQQIGQGSSSPAEDLAFHGPTTSHFSLGIATQSLQTRGITDDGELMIDPSPLGSPRRQSPAPVFAKSPESIDPLWVISKDEALRLCRVYDEEMGLQYPAVDLAQLTAQVHTLYSRSYSTQTSQHVSTPNIAPNILKDDDINILRLVFACALTAEESGHSELGLRIFNSVKNALNEHMWMSPDIRRVIAMMTTATFLFQTDQESLAWRTIGTAQRMCLEMGLHRAETYTRPAIIAFGSEQILRIFWSVYTLEMRFSIGTGLPSQLNSSDIDPSLPYPTDTPYLSAMIDYSRIIEKVWAFINETTNSHKINYDSMCFLDWQVLRWRKALPDSMKLPFLPHQQEQINAVSMMSPDARMDFTKPSRSICRLQSLLYLRGNLARILIYRPVLDTPSRMAQYEAEAESVVDVARDTIRFITHLNTFSDIYQLQQMTFNWFLVCSLATLFVAMAHSPIHFPRDRYRDEFYMAIELVKGFSTTSYVSKRLWKSIKNLRKLASQMEMRNSSRHSPQVESRNDPAAENTNGDAVLQTEGAIFDPLLGNGTTMPSDMNYDTDFSDELLSGIQMSSELTDWFEAFTAQEDAEALFPTNSTRESWQPTSTENMQDYRSEFASIFQGLF